jgi:hypothetical protein
VSSPRPIVITPYYKEDRSLLERCLASVRAQSVPCEHMLVADGHPQEWIDGAGVRHLRLDRAHADFGNTPRGVAAVLAAAEDYTAISFLDADNWLEPDHVAVCLQAAQQAPNGVCDFVVTRSTLRRPDESVIDVRQQPVSEHVDTSCFFFLRGSFHVLASWALMPRQLSPIGDRIFWQALRTKGLSGVIVERATVNYHCIWESIYRAIGENPPPDAKPNIDPTPALNWLRELSDRDLELASRLVGAPLGRP